MLAFLSIATVILLAITSLTLFTSRSWKLSIAALGIQYIGLFFLVVQSWPIDLSIVKTLAGLMASLVLMTALLSNPDSWSQEEFFSPSGIFFRLLIAGVVGILVVSNASKVQSLIPNILPAQAYGGLILILMGLLHLGLTLQPVRVVFGLLTVFSGFEIFYAAMEVSTLVAGLLAVVTLGLALAGAYLLLSSTAEEAG